MTAKSYWQEAYVGGEKDKEAIKSWFGSTAEGMTPYEAAILCDFETDREKKIRAYMTDGEGKKYRFERTLGRKTFSIKRTPIGS